MALFRKIKPRKLTKTKMEMPSGPLYPSFGIDLKHLPEAKEWKVGSNHRIILDTTMTGLNIEKRIGEDYSRADFDIKGIKVVKQIKKLFK